MSPRVIVLEKDPSVARSLVSELRANFSVDVTRSQQELRGNLARRHPDAVVLNIENCALADVEGLRRDFPDLPIVCTHRIPDEEMWMAALASGASDVCAADDVGKVLTSILRGIEMSRNAA